MTRVRGVPLSRRTSHGPGRATARGFTLIEVLVALTLFALMGSVLFGSLRLAGRSWNGGEERVAQVSEMRQTSSFLRTQIGAAYPKHMRKIVELPLVFSGTPDELRYVAPLPERVMDGGLMYFRLALRRENDRGVLVLERTLPDFDAPQMPEFDEDVERTVLAVGISELKLSYYGRDPGAAETETPSWRDRWEDPQLMPILIRVDVKPEKAKAWPTLIVAPRRAPEAGCRVWDYTRSRCFQP